jgi:hypothetical protein
MLRRYKHVFNVIYVIIIQDKFWHVLYFTIFAFIGTHAHENFLFYNAIFIFSSILIYEHWKD